MNAQRLTLFTILLLLANPALAQSGGRFTMVRSVVAAGGGTGNTGGPYALSGTIGQPGAGLLTDARYQASIGFWVVPPLLIFAPLKSGNDFKLSFETEPGRTFHVEFTDSVLSPNWQTLQILLGDGTIKTVTNSAPGVSNRYYRVRQQ